MTARSPIGGARRLPFVLCVHVLIALAIGLIAGSARAEMTEGQRGAILAEAQAAYGRAVSVLRSDPETARAEFRESAKRFQQLVDDGVANGRLHYNLGNALLQSGELGRAILHYRWAETMIPGDAKLEHNLAYARTLRRDRIEPSGGRALTGVLLGWHSGTSRTGRFIVFLVMYLGFWGLLIALLFRRSALLWWIAALLSAIWLATGVSVAVDLLRGDDRTVGVVLAEQVIARKGNGEGFDPQFEEALHEGAEFEVRDHRAGWLQIELPDGSTGWIPIDAAGLIDHF